MAFDLYNGASLSLALPVKGAVTGKNFFGFEPRATVQQGPGQNRGWLMGDQVFKIPSEGIEIRFQINAGTFSEALSQYTEIVDKAKDATSLHFYLDGISVWRALQGSGGSVAKFYPEFIDLPLNNFICPLWLHVKYGRPTKVQAETDALFNAAEKV